MIGKFGKAFDLTQKGLPTNWQPRPGSSMAMWWKPELNNVKGDYYLLGNDRFALCRHDNKIAMAEHISQHRCLLWNKLGLVSEIEKSSIGPNGSITGSPTYESVKFDNGMRVDANGEYVDFDLGVKLTYRGAVEFWFKPLFSSSSVIEARIIDSSPDNLFAGCQWHSTSRFNIWQGYWSANTWTTPPAFLAGDIIHIGYCWDFNGIDGSPDTVRFYWNGILLTSNNPTTTAVDFATTLRVGNNGSNNVYANSVIDNIKIWNYAKTDFSDREEEDGIRFLEGDNGISVPTEQKWYHIGCRINQDRKYDLFLDGEKVHSSTKKISVECFDDLYEKFLPDHWYKMDEVSGASSFYDSGRNTPINGSVMTNITAGNVGVRNTSFGFNGSSSQCYVPDSDDWNFGSGDYTVSIWANATSHGAYEPLIGHHNSQWFFNLNSGVPHFWTSGLFIGNDHDFGGDAVSTGEWHYYIFSRIDGVTTCYVDGNARPNKDDFATWYDATGEFQWGGHTGYWFDGYMDDTRVWKGRGLTATEAKQLYEYTNNYYMEQPKISIGEHIPSKIDNPTHWWPLNERYGNIAYDRNGINGTLNNIAVGNTGPNGSKAYYFNGTNAYINISDSSDWHHATNPFTYSFWVNFPVLPTSGNDNGYAIISHATNSGNTWSILLTNNDYVMDGWWFGHNIGSSSTISFGEGTLSTKANVWYHVIFTRTGNDFAFYINGSKLVTGSDSDTLGNFSNFTIGVNNYGSFNRWANMYLLDLKQYHFGVNDNEARHLYSLGRTPGGEVSDVRYDRQALSDDEMKQLYETNRRIDEDVSEEDGQIRLSTTHN